MNNIVVAVVPILAVLAIAIVALFQMVDDPTLKEVLILAITSIGSMTTGGAVGYTVGRTKPPDKLAKED